MTRRQLALIAGVSYLLIFFAAVYANFFVLEAILQNPVETIQEKAVHVRIGTMAFLVAAVLDVFVAWALFELYKGHALSRVSTYFRVMHATAMGIAVFALPLSLTLTTGEEILRQVEVFNTIWLIGLFFFGIHLMLLGRIVQNIKVIPFMLMLAGGMYVIDTSAHFLLSEYDTYAELFLALVAVPAILGELSFSIWLLARGGKSTDA